MTNAEMKLILDTHFTATRSMITAMDDGINRRLGDLDASVTRRFNKVDKSNEIRNHRLEKAEGRIKQLEITEAKVGDFHLTCPANKMAEKMQKKWFWVAVAITFALAYFILEALYNGTGLGDIISKII